MLPRHLLILCWAQSRDLARAKAQSIKSSQTSFGSRVGKTLEPAFTGLAYVMLGLLLTPVAAVALGIIAAILAIFPGAMLTVLFMALRARNWFGFGVLLVVFGISLLVDSGEGSPVCTSICTICCSIYLYSVFF